MTFIVDSILSEGSMTASNISANGISASNFYGSGAFLTDIPSSNVIGLTESVLPDGNRGDITVSGTSSIWDINENVVDNTKLSNMSSKTYKGRTSVGTGDPEDVSITNMRLDLSIDNVDNTSDSTKNSATASLTNKTINLTNNTVTDTSIALGDLVKSNGTKFVRFDKGSPGYLLSTNPTGTDLLWIDPLTINTVVSYKTIPAISTITTNFTTDTLMPGMELLNVATGSYLLSFGNSVNNDTNNSSITISIYINDVLVTGSPMQWTRDSGQSGVTTIHNFSNFPITLTTNSKVDVRWRVSAGNGTSINRYLTLLGI